MAKSVVKNIIVALRAQLAGNFSGVMAKGKAAVASVSQAAGGVGRTMAIAGAGIVAGVTAAAGGLAAYVTHVSGSMAATGKLADRLGIGTEALVGLQYALGKSGMSAEQVNKTLEGFNRRVGEAAMGAGEAGPILQRMGLDAKKLAELPLDQRMMSIADALAKIPNEAQRAAIAAKLLGEEGAGMAATLAKGGPALAAAMKQAADMGLTYSRQTAAQAEAVRATMGRISSVIEGAGIKAVSAILPWMQRAADAISGWIGGVLPSLPAAFSAAFEVIGSVLASVWSYIETVFEAWGNIWNSLTGTTTGAGGLISAVLDGIKIAFQWFATGVIKAVTFMEAVIVNWRDALTVVIAGATLGIVSFSLDVGHWFTVVVPAYLQYFAENWRAIFTTAWNFLKTFATNVGTNLWNLGKAIKGFFTSGDWNFQWTGLLDGFENTLKAMPEIAGRTSTELEKNLAASVKDASDNISTYYDKRVDERLNKLADRQDEAKKIAADIVKGTDAAARPEEKKFDKALAAPAAAAKREQDFGVLGARMSLAFMVRDQRSQPLNAVAKNTEDAAATLKKIYDRQGDGTDAVSFA